MQQANISIRVDKTVKDRFCDLCNSFGLTTTTAFNLFMKAVIRERKIPFEISVDETQSIEQRGLQAFETLREQASSNKIQDLSLEEINNIIKQTRDERKKSAN